MIGSYVPFGAIGPSEPSLDAVFRVCTRKIVAGNGRAALYFPRGQIVHTEGRFYGRNGR